MGLIGQNQQTTFADPQAGQSPISAAVVRNNDNALVAKHNAHDADATLHVQTGLLSARPAAGTAGAMYMDETGRIYRDGGAAWVEVGYARLAATDNIFTGNLTVEGNAALEGDVAIDGTTVCEVLSASDIGADTVTANTLTGAHVGDGSGLTALPAAQLTGTLGTMSGANLTNLNGSNISSGTVAQARLPSSYTVLSTSGTLTLSSAAGSPGTVNALSVASDYVTTGASTPTALASAPVTGTGWVWVKVATNLGDGWMPILLAA